MHMSNDRRLPDSARHLPGVDQQSPAPSWPVCTPTWPSRVREVFSGSGSVLRPWMGAAVIVAGNLLFHLYCQSWHWVRPNHVPSGYAWLALVGVILMIIEIGRDLLNRDLCPAAIVLPSAVLGVTSIVAFLASWPGIEAWFPFFPQVDFVGELEMFLLSCGTIAQLILYGAAVRR